MTQAYNLSQLANNLNSAGQLDATDGLVNAVPVANGGTGASTAAAARSNLGLGTIATQNANAVAVTGGSISGITDLAVADGGTGASTAAGARTNLDVPSTTGGGASGTWGINISGNAATATTATNSTNGLGIGQTWQDVTSSRAISTTYTNNTSKPIMVSVQGTAGSAGTALLYIDGLLMCAQSIFAGAADNVQGIVPVGSTYRYEHNNGGSMAGWYELR